MAHWGNEFVNITSIESAPPGASARGDNAANDAPALAAAIAQVTSPRPPYAGGIVYFPPGTYRMTVPESELPGVTRARHRATIVEGELPPWRLLRVPENVGLMFAPGAMIALDEFANLEIAGPIFAERAQIFTSPTPRLATRGRVLFAGAPIHELYPEWWGAGAPGVSDSDALQAAVDAAYTHQSRRRWDFFLGAETGALDFFSSIPIALAGTYLLDRTIQIGGRSRHRRRDGVALRCGLGVGTRTQAPAGTPAQAPLAPIPTIAASASFSGQELIAFQDAAGCSVEGAHLDAGFRAASCVSLRTERAAPGSVFRRCTFERATTRLVGVGEPVEMPLRAALLADPVGTRSDASNATRRRGDGDFSGLRFEACSFLPSTPPRSQPISAVEIRAWRSRAIQFTDCQFVGTASAMLLIWGGVVWVSGGEFVNAVQPSAEVAARGGLAGSDIYLARPPVEVGTDERVRPGVPGSFSLTQCSSKSRQVVATFEGTDRRFTRPSVMMDVVHRPQGGTPGAATPPTARWGLPARLVVLASSLRGFTLTGLGRTESTASVVGPIVQGPMSQHRFAEASAAAHDRFFSVTFINDDPFLA